MHTTIPVYSFLAMELPESLSSSTSLSSSIIEKYPYVINAIPLSEIYDAMSIVTWSKGTVYSSYGNILSASNPSIVKYGDTVWLCISNNLKNIKDQSNSSNYIPSAGRLTDGYEWLRLFDLDNTNRGLYTKVPSHTGIVEALKVNEDNFCTDGTKGITGNCLLYLTDGITATFLAGISADCVACNTLSNSLINGDVKVSFSLDFDSSDVTLLTSKEKLANVIASDAGSREAKLNFNISSYNDSLSRGISAGCIIGVNIDSAYLYTGVNTGLTIGISGGSGNIGGTGADVKFMFTSVVGNTGNISGITLNARGEDYGTQIIATVVGLGGASGTNLSNAISLIVPSSFTDISITSSIFDLRSSFSTDVITLINATFNPTVEGIDCNAYALLVNHTSTTLPSNVTGIKHFTPSAGSVSEYLRVNFIRA